MELGSIIVVDDCVEHPYHDGAFQTCCEFLEERRLGMNVLCGRLGLIRIQETSA